MIFELREFLDNRQIPYEEVCIVGSFPLGLYGIRRAHDLDFIVSSKYAGQFPAKAVKVTKNCEKVAGGWLRRKDKILFSDNEIIENPGWSVRYRGFKVVKMPFVIYKKAVNRREKDLEDLRLINSYLKDTGTGSGGREEKAIAETGKESSERRG